MISPNEMQQGLQDRPALHRTAAPYIVVFVAVAYNALLAAINAHLHPVNSTYVMAAEAGIIASALYLSMQATRAKLAPWLPYLFLFGFIFAVTSTLTMIEGNSPSLKPLRDMLIVIAFGMLGAAQGERGRTSKLMFWLSVVVLGFLLLERFLVDTFIQIFQITSYYLNTRTLSDALTNERADVAGGLFFTANSFEGRFSLGFRAAQRLSSIFLEPTTHANFAILCMIYVLTFWRSLGKTVRLSLVITPILIVLGTDSRQILAMMGLLVAMRVFDIQRLPRYTLAWYMPATLLLMLLFFYDPSALPADTIGGRLTRSINMLLSLSPMDWLGANQGATVVDSGFTYVLASQSIVGLIALWIMLFTLPKYETREQRFFAHAIMMFFTINLAVSGSTIFSIKTSALLWFLAGMIGQDTPGKPAAVERRGPKHVGAA